ncbi:MAG TPA: YdhR family protein [Candidatus Limnocylindrales bacterium]|nr:YdhR family protein [Candidatus Limnocylindrales bacterium]
MHAMLITFTSSADLGDLEQPFGDYAKGLRTVDGLISKTWLHEGRTLGGFHLFTSREAADAYLAGEMVARLTATPAFADFEIRHWDVLEELSAINGTPQLARA